MVSGLCIGLRRRGGLHEIFAAAQRMDVGRQHLDGHRIEPVAPCRHRAYAWIGDLSHDVFPGAAVEPDGVRQVRRADGAVALTGGPMTDGAVLLEKLSA